MRKDILNSIKSETGSLDEYNTLQKSQDPEEKRLIGKTGLKKCLPDESSCRDAFFSAT